MSNDMFGAKEFEEMSLSDAFDIPISNIEDAQNYYTPPRGYYEFTLSVKKDNIGKGDNQKEAIVCTFVTDKIVELADPKEIDKFKQGGLVGRNYTAGKGVQRFVTDFREIMIKMGLNTVKEACEKMQEIKVKGFVDHTKDAEDKTKIYANVQNVSLI